MLFFIPVHGKKTHLPTNFLFDECLAILCDGGEVSVVEQLVLLDEEHCFLVFMVAVKICVWEQTHT